jgi:hypothetical protein
MEEKNDNNTEQEEPKNTILKDEDDNDSEDKECDFETYFRKKIGNVFYFLI